MAISVPCESLFSDAGYALWQRRTALGAKKSEKVVLIQHNENLEDLVEVLMPFIKILINYSKKITGAIFFRLFQNLIKNFE